MEFEIRPGGPGDLPALASLDSSFSNEWLLWLERRGDPLEQTVTLRWRPAGAPGSRRQFALDAEYLRRELARSDRLLVAERDARPAGYLFLAENWNRTAELVELIVDARYRRQGLGRRFLAEAEVFARERALRALQWEAQTDNRAAIEFAVSQGFRLAGFHDALYGNRGDRRQGEADFRGLAVFLTREVSP